MIGKTNAVGGGSLEELPVIYIHSYDSDMAAVNRISAICRGTTSSVTYYQYTGQESNSMNACNDSGTLTACPVAYGLGDVLIVSNITNPSYVDMSNGKVAGPYTGNRAKITGLEILSNSTGNYDWTCKLAYEGISIARFTLISKYILHETPAEDDLIVVEFDFTTRTTTVISIGDDAICNANSNVECMYIINVEKIA